MACPSTRRIILTKLSRVLRCLRLPANTAGRDLVVGDLHGHRSLLEQELDALQFDPSRDRVLSVGDLIDRGPDSLATLMLIEQPWFRAVLGNHELMLLHHLGYYSSRLHSRKVFAGAGGEWLRQAFERHRKTLHGLADRVAALPPAIHVAGELPFNVMHGDLQPLGSTQHRLLRDDAICVHKADGLTSSRHNIGAALRLKLLDLRFAEHRVQISPTPLGELPITYAGHSPVRCVTVHNSYVYIDQGVCAPGARRAATTPPTVIDHQRFARWLGGVTTARAGVSVATSPARLAQATPAGAAAAPAEALA